MVPALVSQWDWLSEAVEPGRPSWGLQTPEDQDPKSGAEGHFPNLSKQLFPSLRFLGSVCPTDLFQFMKSFIRIAISCSP